MAFLWFVVGVAVGFVVTMVASMCRLSKLEEAYKKQVQECFEWMKAAEYHKNETDNWVNIAVDKQETINDQRQKIEKLQKEIKELEDDAKTTVSGSVFMKLQNDLKHTQTLLKNEENENGKLQNKLEQSKTDLKLIMAENEKLQQACKIYEDVIGGTQ